jgi:hypothetical protein
MSELAALLPLILPKAIAWAEGQSKLIMEHGFQLTPAGITDARTVGVARPENIRVAFVPSLPLPEDDELRTIALNAGLLGPGMIGLTLGYGIFIVQGHETRRLCSHEFRHVHQYEHAGSIAAFLPEYLNQVSSFGYRDSPFEIDARRHELL